MRDPVQPPQPWVGALALSLAEALPRLYGTPRDPLVDELIAALTAALVRGELELDLHGPKPAEQIGRAHV